MENQGSTNADQQENPVENDGQQDGTERAQINLAACKKKMEAVAFARPISVDEGTESRISLMDYKQSSIIRDATGEHYMTLQLVHGVGAARCGVNGRRPP